METPCTKVCKLDATGRVCVGCRRTIDEIVRWASLSEEERRAIMMELRRRPLPDQAPDER
jgi:uncharacterized protein